MNGDLMQKADRPVLVQQDQAITSYLEALLSEVPPARKAVAAPARAPVQTAAEVLPVPAPVETPPEPHPPVTEPRVVTPPAVSEAPVPADPVPDWAQPRFEALLCRVHRLWLAIPLCHLRHVLRWPAAGVTPIPNAPPWMRGMMPHRGGHLRVIDMPTLVLPPDRRLDPAPEPGFILNVGDGEWGLACNALGEVVKLTPEAVQWRPRAGHRPWLAGTVRERLCALIAVESLVALARDAQPGAAPDGL